MHRYVIVYRAGDEDQGAFANSILEAAALIAGGVVDDITNAQPLTPP